jgi:hypothetical protein
VRRNLIGRIRVVGEKVILKRASEVNETLLILNIVVNCCNTRLSVRTQHSILLLLQVLLQLQIVEGIR